MSRFSTKRRRWRSSLHLPVTFICYLGFAPLAVAPAGCGNGQEAMAGSERAQALRERFAAIEREFAELPRSNPVHLAAYTRLRTKLSACKINFKSKEKARLGSITEALYQNVTRELDEIEKLIRDYPR